MAPYLQNPHHHDLDAALSDWLSRPCSPGFQTWALADVSILGVPVLRQMERLSPSTCALLEGSRYAAYEELGPHLISTDASELPRLRRLLALTNGFPALSFVEVASSNGMPQRETLATLASVETQDGMEMFCRISDTRVLPAVLVTLEPEQRNWLARTVRRWAWADRNGRLATQVFEPPAGAEPNTRATLLLNDVQFLTLMHAAEPDILHQLLRDISPEIIPDAQPAEVHAQLSRLLEFARQYGIHDAPDQLQFITIAWSASEQFHELPCLDATWTATRNGQQRFRDAVANWSDAQWALIEATRVAPQKSTCR